MYYHCRSQRPIFHHLTINFCDVSCRCQADCRVSKALPLGMSPRVPEDTHTCICYHGEENKSSPRVLPSQRLRTGKLSNELTLIQYPPIWVWIPCGSHEKWKLEITSSRDLDFCTSLALCLRLLLSFSDLLTQTKPHYWLHLFQMGQGLSWNFL